jgi:hypothetical protein
MWQPDLILINYFKNPHPEKMSLIIITYVRPVAVPAVHNAVQQLFLLRCTQKESYPNFSHHRHTSTNSLNPDTRQDPGFDDKKIKNLQLKAFMKGFKLQGKPPVSKR